MRLLLLLYLVAAVYASDYKGPDLEGVDITSTRGHEIAAHAFSKYKPVFANWNLHGTAFGQRERVRLTRAAESQAGSMWNKHALDARDWEMVLEARVWGGRPNADGMAIWLSDTELPTGGEWGVDATETWKGIALLIDTYTNDASATFAYNPTVSLMMADNDHQEYVHYDEDGKNLRVLGSAGEEMCHFTSSSEKPFKLLARYVHSTLSVWLAEDGESEWRKCIEYENIFLPTGYRIGLSAQTGQLFSNHDVQSFRVYELTTPPHTDEPVREPKRVEREGAKKVDASDPRNSSLVSWILVALVILGLAFGAFSLYDKFVIDQQKKHFY